MAPKLTTGGLGRSSSAEGSSSSCSSLCPVCFCQVEAAGTSVAPPCGHAICADCAVHYFCLKVMERAGVIRCVHPTCDCDFTPEQVLRFVGEDLHSKYESYTVEAAIRTDPNVRFCPTPDCDYAVIGHPDRQVIKCEKCTNNFCFDCSRPWQSGHICRRSSIEDVGPTCKRCPKCHMLVEKVQDGSCNHMTCAGCTCEFCWLCGEEIFEFNHYWTPSGCTYFGTKKWGQRKRVAVTAGILASGPALVVACSVVVFPSILFGLPITAARRARKMGRPKLEVIGRGTSVAIAAPIVAATTVAVGVPLGLGVIYCYVPYTFLKDHQKRRRGRAAAAADGDAGEAGSADANGSRSRSRCPRNLCDDAVKPVLASGSDGESWSRSASPPPG